MFNPIHSCLLTIAGHDPSSGAGVSADMAAASALGVPCCSAITALTVQNSQGVSLVHPVSPKIVQAQVVALLADMPIAIIKIGMIGSLAMVSRLVNVLADVDVPIVLDPVFKASIGENLLDTGARLVFSTRLLPMATLITPNIPEAEQLTGLTIDSRERQLAAAEALLAMGAKAVLLKGGHFVDSFAADLLLERAKPPVWLIAPTIDSRHSHGSGCVLASSIAAGLVQGLSLVSAVVQAKARVHAGIAQSRLLGKGVGAVATTNITISAQDFPRVLWGEKPYFMSPEPFVPMLHAMKIYPVLDKPEDMLPLLHGGCRTLQLRIKDPQHPTLKADIARAIEICAAFPDSQLFINDHWQIALELGAFGVHLGQEDWQALSLEDQTRLRHSGVRLGLSTHNYAEMAIAVAVAPSYIAIGPLFHTNSKVMAHVPVSIERLGVWLTYVKPYPVVTIGGIGLEHIRAICATGVDGAAVMSALYGDSSSDIMAKAQQFVRAWG